MTPTLALNAKKRWGRAVRPAESGGTLPVRDYMDTDVGNGERFVAAVGEDVVFVAEWQRWVVWDGRRWAKDETGVVHRYAKDVIRRLYRDAAEHPKADRRAALAKWAAKSESNGAIKAMLERARHELLVDGTPMTQLNRPGYRGGSFS